MLQQALNGAYLSCDVPDQDFATFIHCGLMQGFRIGYQARTDGLKASHKNHLSSLAAAAIVDERISSELLAGRLLGPLPRNLEALVHTSRLALFPNHISQTNGGSLSISLALEAAVSTTAYPQIHARYSMLQ